MLLYWTIRGTYTIFSGHGNSVKAHRSNIDHVPYRVRSEIDLLLTEGVEGGRQQHDSVHSDFWKGKEDHQLLWSDWYYSDPCRFLEAVQQDQLLWQLRRSKQKLWRICLISEFSWLRMRSAPLAVIVDELLQDQPIKNLFLKQFFENILLIILYSLM